MLLVSLVGCMVWIGIYPKPIFDLIDKPVDYVVQKVDPQYYTKAVIPSAAEREGSPSRRGSLAVSAARDDKPANLLEARK